MPYLAYIILWVFALVVFRKSFGLGAGFIAMLALFLLVGALV